MIEGKRYQDIELIELIQVLQDELDKEEIPHHISWVITDETRTAYIKNKQWPSFAEKIAELFDLVVLQRFVNGVCYMAFMQRQYDDEQ